MEEREREEVFSKAVKAGKRTYFFDVKETKQGERYITITESKRKFDNDGGTFSYEKHKIFLYREDLNKFQRALSEAADFAQQEAHNAGAVEWAGEYAPHGDSAGYVNEEEDERFDLNLDF
mgnify:CR=1 FL=1